MTLFLKAMNPIFSEILVNGPFVPMKAGTPTEEQELARITPTSVPKAPSEFTAADNELVVLDTHLQLYIVESMDVEMSH